MHALQELDAAPQSPSADSRKVPSLVHFLCSAATPARSAHNSQEWIRREKHGGSRYKSTTMDPYLYLYVHAGSVREYTVYTTPHGATASGTRELRREGPFNSVPWWSRSSARHALACLLPLCPLRRYIPSLCAVDRGLVGSGRFRGGGFVRMDGGIDVSCVCLCVVDWWSPLASHQCPRPSAPLHPTHG